MFVHLFSAVFLVKRSYNELYKSVESGETRMALVDMFSTPQHSQYYDEYKLYVATVLSERVIYGAVLPMGTENITKCFLDYHGNHQLEVHEIVHQFRTGLMTGFLVTQRIVHHKVFSGLI